MSSGVSLPQPGPADPSARESARPLLDLVTLTGVGEGGDPGVILDLRQQFPFAEFGIHFVTGRRRRLAWLEVLFAAWSPTGLGPFLSAHLSHPGEVPDSWLRQVCSGDWSFLTHLHAVWPMFGRVQLNLRTQLERVRPGAFVGAMQEALDGRQVILQLDRFDHPLLEQVRAARLDAVPLFDLSGGRGLAPDCWPRSRDFRCGYAGGLKADDLDAKLAAIARVATGAGGVWIDAQRDLRSRGRFDPARARRFLEAAEPWARGSRLNTAVLEFETLWSENWKLPYGYFRSRAGNDAEAQSMLEALYRSLKDEIEHQKPAAFDPAKGPFRPFVRMRARRQEKRFYSRPSGRWYYLNDFKKADDPDDRALASIASRVDPAASVTSSPEDPGEVDEAVRRMTLSRELLETLLHGRPHQLLVFLLTHVGGGPEAAIKKPQEIVDEYSDQPLESLLQLVVEAYERTSHLTSDEIRSVFAPLYNVMARVGTTTLSDYYGTGDAKKRAARVHDWCYRLKQRVAKTMGVPPPKTGRDSAADALPVPVPGQGLEARLYEALLQAVVNLPNPLHEIVVALQDRLCDPGGRPWSSGGIVRACSERTLKKLVEDIQNEYVRASGLPKNRVRSAFNRLRTRLNAPVPDEVAARHRDRFEELVVGNTALQHYYKIDRPLRNEKDELIRHLLRNEKGKLIKRLVTECADEVDHWQDAVFVGVYCDLLRARRHGEVPGKQEVSASEILKWIASRRRSGQKASEEATP